MALAGTGMAFKYATLGIEPITLKAAYREEVERLYRGGADAAQAKRDAKKAAAVKGKPGRKRKSSAHVAAKAKGQRGVNWRPEEEIEAEGMGDHCSVFQL